MDVWSFTLSYIPPWASVVGKFVMILFFRSFPSLLVWSKTEEGTIKVPACRDWACSSKTGAKKREPVTAYLRYSLPVCLLIPPHRQVSLALVVVGDGHGGAY